MEMCDLVKRSSCLGSTGKKIGPVKLSKWELPIPRSKSYWDGVCAEIEKKHKRVRDAYPFSAPPQPLSAPSSRTQFHDDFKFKISPPTPMHKTPTSARIDFESDRLVSPVGVISCPDDKIIEVPAPKKVEIDARSRRQKMFTKKSCPLHKNISSVKIFDDEILKYLKTDVPTLPDIAKKKSPFCDSHKASRSKSTSASSTRSRETQKSMLQERRVSKAPKLGAASLLPSFARAVSTDSSVGTTRSSFESVDEQVPKARDFLRVPNLSFVSSHPSFRKLSFVDSVDDEESSSQLGKKVETKDEVVETKKEKRDKKSRNMPEIEKEYAYKALEVLTKKSDVNVKRKTEDSSEKSSVISEVLSIPDVPKFKKLMRNLDKESSIDFREVRQKLRRLTSQSRERKSVSFELDKMESRTIYSASRSTSSSSPDFESKAIEVSSTDALENIPETKVFQRAYIDKCHACLFKPFKSETKITRELPLATLVSVIKEPSKFRVASSSSSSTTEEIQFPSICDYKDDIFDLPDFEGTDYNEETSKIKQQEVKDHPRVSFDQSNLTGTETRDESQSLKSDHHLKERSFSMPLSDRSKTSTPSNQSSESDDARGPQDGDKLPSSKFMAPCHAPVVLRKSLEPYRALKQKKFISLKARAAAITAKSSEGSDSGSQGEDAEVKKAEEIVEGEKKEKKKKKKKKKKLVRMKSFVAKATEFSASMDVSDIKDKKLLKRAKTTFDLLYASEESKSGESSEEEEGEEVSVETEETKVEEKEEQLPLADAIVMHRPGPAASPIMSSHDVIDIVKACLQEDFSPANLLERLNNEFIDRMNERYERLKDSEDAQYLRLGLDLFNALIDSRRYLKPYTFDPNLKFSHKQPPLTNSRQLRRILPPQSYQLVAPILGMPKYAESLQDEDESLSSDSTDSALTFDLQVHPPTPRGGEKSGDTREVNPYSLFLRKPRRKVVVWRPLREEDLKGYDPEATLEMRATRLMDRICKEFCDWVRQLGEQVIDEETLKDMFEINFTSDACKSMQVVIKEMPTVPLPVVKVRHCPEANELEATKKQMRQDLKVEARPNQTFAFGRSLPRNLRFVPPRTSIVPKWLDCEYIPKDLENMDVVWDDIGNLDSVQEFYNFLKSKKVLRSSKLLTNLEQAMKRQI